MIEILSNVEVLTAPIPDLSVLMMRGIRYGASAESIPPGKVVEVALAPIVARSSWDDVAGSRYWDAEDRELSHKEVVECVAAGSGVLHLGDGLSFGIEAGCVAAFTLHGPALNCFSHIVSHNELLKLFGQSSRSLEDRAYGDLMGYKHYYDESKKEVWWDCTNNKITLIRLGTTSWCV